MELRERKEKEARASGVLDEIVEEEEPEVLENEDLTTIKEDEDENRPSLPNQSALEPDQNMSNFMNTSSAQH